MQYFFKASHFRSAKLAQFVTLSSLRIGGEYGSTLTSAMYSNSSDMRHLQSISPNLSSGPVVKAPSSSEGGTELVSIWELKHSIRWIWMSKTQGAQFDDSAYCRILRLQAPFSTYCASTEFLPQLCKPHSADRLRVPWGVGTEIWGIGLPMFTWWDRFFTSRFSSDNHIYNFRFPLTQKGSTY